MSMRLADLSGCRLRRCWPPLRGQRRRAGPGCCPRRARSSSSAKQMGVPVEGKFKKFDAQLDSTRRSRRPAASRCTIDIGSAALGVPEADAELPKPIWFDTAKFPQATFESTRHQGRSAAASSKSPASSTSRASKRDVVVPVTLTRSRRQSPPPAAASSSSGSTSRSATANGPTPSMVANDVQVKFKLALSGLGPP